MQITKNKVVTIDYTLTDTEGAVIDTSKGAEPLSYIQGTGSIVPGLEAALEGRSAGDELKVSIPPDSGYGHRDESLMLAIPRTAFEGIAQIEPGMQFVANSGSSRQMFTIVAVEDDQVQVDGNHPLAGMTLNFDVTIREVRDATGEELDHGHAHSGENGH
jgi:FKBP-type peptidyl-prolyl cis-trans isomerase SlyD